MSLIEQYNEIEEFIEKTRETGSETWAAATKALIKLLIRKEVPHASNFLLKPHQEG